MRLDEGYINNPHKLGTQHYNMQQPSVASAEGTRDGAEALSDEEVLGEAMVRAQRERTELEARSSQDRDRGGGGRGDRGRASGGRGGRGRGGRGRGRGSWGDYEGDGRGGSLQSTGSEQEGATARGTLPGAGVMKQEDDGAAGGAAEGQEEEGSSQGGELGANSLGNSPVRGDRCWAPWCGSKGEQRLEKWIPDQEMDCITCGWKVEQNKG